MTISPAVIEIAFDGDVVNVVAEDGGHLPALHFRHALVRVQDEDIDVLATAAAFDGSRTGVTGGGSHDHHALATLGQHVVEQTAEQLQGEILKAKVGPWNSSSTHSLPFSWRSGAMAPWAKTP